jgi:hypothetical protein
MPWIFLDAVDFRNTDDADDADFYFGCCGFLILDAVDFGTRMTRITRIYMLAPPSRHAAPFLRKSAEDLRDLREKSVRNKKHAPHTLISKSLCPF